MSHAQGFNQEPHTKTKWPHIKTKWPHIKTKPESGLCQRGNPWQMLNLKRSLGWEWNNVSNSTELEEFISCHCPATSLPESLLCLPQVALCAGLWYEGDIDVDQHYSVVQQVKCPGKTAFALVVALSQNCQNLCPAHHKSSSALVSGIRALVKRFLMLSLLSIISDSDNWLTFSMIFIGPEAGAYWAYYSHVLGLGQKCACTWSLSQCSI